MRCALINPPDLGRSRELNRAAPPLGLGYVASYLENNGINCDLYDLAHLEDSAQFEALETTAFVGYEVYGFTSYTVTYPGVLSLVDWLRARNPNCVVVVGGPHVSACADEVIQDSRIDFVVRRDGEVPMLALVRALMDGCTGLERVPGITYRTGWSPADRASGRSVAVNSDPEALPHLDELPFPKRQYVIEPDRREAVISRRGETVPLATLASSRGCPKRCTFCSIIVMNPKYRFRTIPSLMQEIHQLRKRFTFKHLTFADANFFVNTRRTLDFSRALYELDPTITWSGTATADTIVRHGTILPEIGRLNCSHLEVGLESGSPDALARFNKWTTVEQNEEAVRLLRSAGISLNLDFIMFDPEATIETLRENISFLFRTELFGEQPMECLTNALKVYPGTPAREKYVAHFGLCEHHLMSPWVPFYDPAVEAVHRAMASYARRYKSRLESAAETLRLQGTRKALALAIHLRHLPFSVFLRLLDASGEMLVDLAREDRRLACDDYPETEEALVSAANNSELPGTRAHDGWCTEDVRPQDGLLVVEEHLSVYLVPTRGPVRRLNHSASELWRLLRQSRDARDVPAQYAQRMRCDVAQASAYLAAFLADMKEAGILVPPNPMVNTTPVPCARA